MKANWQQGWNAERTTISMGYIHPAKWLLMCIQDCNNWILQLDSKHIQPYYWRDLIHNLTVSVSAHNIQGAKTRTNFVPLTTPFAFVLEYQTSHRRSGMVAIWPLNACKGLIYGCLKCDEKFYASKMHFYTTVSNLLCHSVAWVMLSHAHTNWCM